MRATQSTAEVAGFHRETGREVEQTAVELEHEGQPRGPAAFGLADLRRYPSQFSAWDAASSQASSATVAATAVRGTAELLTEFKIMIGEMPTDFAPLPPSPVGAVILGTELVGAAARALIATLIKHGISSTACNSALRLIQGLVSRSRWNSNQAQEAQSLIAASARKAENAIKGIRHLPDGARSEIVGAIHSLRDHAQKIVVNGTLKD